MGVIKDFLCWLSGVGPGVAFALWCGDDLVATAHADALNAAKAANAAAAPCNCPEAEPPLAGRFVTVNQVVTIGAMGTGGDFARCPMGSQPIFGSCTADQLNPIRNLTVQQAGFYLNAPLDWYCFFRNNEMFSVTVRASVTCLKSPP
jgi:hypothetical protein